MLTALAIRNIVLIEQLDLEFGPGLWVVTGETGAGKSILLDSLGLAVGGRADKSLVRHDTNEAVITAEFCVGAAHPVWGVLDAFGLTANRQEPLILRRVQQADGRSKGYINDQPAGVAALAEVGGCLLEIHGQHAERGLLEAASHRAVVDSFAGAEKAANATRAAFEAWKEAEGALDASRAAQSKAAREQDYLRHAVDELTALDPQPNEEQALALERSDMMKAEKIAEDLTEAATAISGDDGVALRLGQTYRALARAEQKAPAILSPAVEALDKACLEMEAVEAALETARAAARHDPDRLNRIEERLFALRAMARKHQVEADSLPALRAQMEQQLADLDRGQDTLAALERAADAARRQFDTQAKSLSEARHKAAAALDKRIKSELKPLKLDKATFRTRVETGGAEEAGAHGLDRVWFEVSTNPGAPFGPLTQIASGGEFVRFILALKAVLAQRQSRSIVIFDEIDQGVGGAVAAAVGERLARLSEGAQVLVVTHSPQVAARGDCHLRIEKKDRGKGNISTSVEVLEGDIRREEIARMLSGARVTEEARAAAGRLLQESARKPAKTKLKTGTAG